MAGRPGALQRFNQSPSGFEFSRQSVNETDRFSAGQHLPGVCFDFEMRGVIEPLHGGQRVTQRTSGGLQRPEIFGVHRDVKMDPPALGAFEVRRRFRNELFREVGDTRDISVGRLTGRLMKVSHLHVASKCISSRGVGSRVIELQGATDVDLVDTDACGVKSGN